MPMMAARKVEETMIVPLPLFLFEGSLGWQAHEHLDEHNQQPMMTTFSVLTWNCWAVDEHAGPVRYRAIAAKIIETDADFVALQEVTETALASLRDLPAMQDAYALSDISGRTFAPCFYGVVLLVRRRVLSCFRRCTFSLQRMPTTMSRQLAVLELVIDEKNTLAVATTHLESTYELSFMRRIQLQEVVYPRLNGHSHVIFMGDMNIVACTKENEVFASSGLIDVWNELSTDRPLPEGTTLGFRPKRIDRVFYRFAKELPLPPPVEYELLGAERVMSKPLKSSYPIETASDHLAIRVSFSGVIYIFSLFASIRIQDHRKKKKLKKKKKKPKKIS
ncbi:MAG: endonuclease/exonuclease/phosphatase family protein, partial [Microbacteriaceae bacterium]|nr:endonuclease/exonuclease/phosphatase family protein [Microbacteriaceae bacterium]